MTKWYVFTNSVTFYGCGYKLELKQIVILAFEYSFGFETNVWLSEKYFEPYKF